MDDLNGGLPPDADRRAALPGWEPEWGTDLATHRPGHAVLANIQSKLASASRVDASSRPVPARAVSHQGLAGGVLTSQTAPSADVAPRLGTSVVVSRGSSARPGPCGCHDRAPIGIARRLGGISCSDTHEERAFRHVRRSARILGRAGPCVVWVMPADRRIGPPRRPREHRVARAASGSSRSGAQSARDRAP